MVNNPSSNTSTKIRLLYRTGGDHAPEGERLWAQQLPDPPGRYRLNNNAFHVPLRVGDVVRTRIDRHGMPQIVGIESLALGPVSVVQVPPWLSEQYLEALVHQWCSLGAVWTEGHNGTVITAWVDHATPSSIREVLSATVPTWQLLELTTRRQRAVRLPLEIDDQVDLRTVQQLQAEHDAVCNCGRIIRDF